MDQIQIERLRKDTPGCGHVYHFNNAGSALPPLPVLHAVKEHLDLEATIGGYEAARVAQHKAEKFYDNAAKLLNCTRNEIAFMENATRAWDMIFYSFKFNKGDRIITAQAEYASNYLAFLHAAKHTGVIIDVIKNDAYGQLDLEDLRNKIDDKVRLIAITHVPTQGGLINPAAEIGKIAKEFNIPYLLDATQTVGQMPIDVDQIGCDFACTTGRKFLRGPRGTGFLYIRQSKIAELDPPFIDLHSAQWISENQYQLSDDAKRFETWEQYVAGKIGLSAAIEYALEIGMEAIWERITHLANYLRNQLAEIPSVELQDQGKNKCGIVTFTCKNKSAQDIQKQLAEKKINVSVSLLEYARLDLEKRNLAALIRSSVHYYNTEDEILHFCHELKKIVEK